MTESTSAKSATDAASAASLAAQAAANAAAAASDVSVNQDINTPEAFKAHVYTATRNWAANEKALFDRYSDFDAMRARELHAAGMESARRSADRFDALMSDARVQVNHMWARELIELTNAQSQSNGENQRTVRHADLAIDHQWNVDEQAHVVARILTEDQPFIDALAAKAVGKVSDNGDSSS